MLLFRLWAYLRGYLLLWVWGEVEKFVNLAIQRGIRLWDIRRGAGGAWLKADLPSVKALRHVARRSRSRFSIHSRYGLPFLLAKLKKRWMLMAGGLFFLGALYFLSSFIWSIEVRPEGELLRVSPEEVVLAAKRHGLGPGIPKWRVDREKAALAIGMELPRLAWVGVELKGTRAVLYIVEKVLPPEVEAAPVDLVSTRDGVVREILVLVGRALVKEGDAVKRGQVLIAGEQQAGQAVASLRAKGIVKAAVWYEAIGEAARREERQVKTGRRATAYLLQAGEREILLRGPGVSPYEDYREEKASRELPSLPGLTRSWVLVSRTFWEARREILLYTREEAEKLAVQRARSFVEALQPKTTSLDEVSREASWNGGKVRIRLVLEGVEDIGVHRIRR